MYVFKPNKPKIAVGDLSIHDDFYDHSHGIMNKDKHIANLLDAGHKIMIMNMKGLVSDDEIQGINEAIEAAIEALKANQWFKPSFMSPAHGEYVLAAWDWPDRKGIESGTEIAMFSHNTGKWQSSWYTGPASSGARVTLWKPLPKPPIAELNKQEGNSDT